MSDIGKIIRVNALPPLDERENNVIYQVAAPGAATYQDYAIDANGDLKIPSYIPLTGTEEGKPLTKNIEVDHNEEGSVGFISNTPDVSEAVIAIQEDDSVLAESRNNTDNSSSSIFVHHDTGIEISATTPNEQFSAIVDVSGLQGNEYIQPTSDQHYVQRKYIADNFTSQTALNSTLTNYYTKPETYSKTEVDAKFSTVYRPKGSVNNLTSLPTTGNIEGDVWNLLDTGANYVWVTDLNNTGAAGWDKLSETVDLTNYVTLNTDQNIESRKQFIRNGGYENWDNNSITLLGLGGKFAGLTFYSSGFDIGQLTFNGNFNFLNQDSTGYKNLVAQGYYRANSSNSYFLLGGGGHLLASSKANALENATSIGFSNGSIPTDDGSQYPYIAHETAGFIPLATQGFANGNFNKINRTTLLTNASDSNINKTWFDYTWAGGNNAGSVISFSGLNDAYSTELFGEYNNGGNRFGLRTHNGDTPNTWNPVRWIWHDGNFNPSDFVPLTDLNNYLTSRRYWNTALLAKTDFPNSVTFHAEDTNISGFQSFYGTSLHIKGDQPWYNRLDFPVNAEKIFLYQGINTTDMTLRGYMDILGPNVTNWTSSNLDPSNYIDKTSSQDIGNQKRFTGISTEWILDGNSATNARGFVQSLDTGFYTGTVNNKDYGIYRNTVQKILVQDNITTFNTNIYSTGTVIANNYNSNTLAGGVLIATNSLEAYIGNSAMTNLVNQTGSAHIWNVAGNNIGYMDTGGLAIYGALLVNNSNVLTESQKGIANGVAPLGSDSKISSAYLPSYVDDVLEFANLISFPVTGESGKIYVALDTNLTYRWGGSSYTQIAAGAVQSVNGHVGIVTLAKSDLGLANADNTSDAAKNVLSATKWTTPRTLSYTGDVTGSASVDGSGNVGFAMTLANSGVSAGTYNSVNVDTKGRVLSGSNINYATESYVADLLQQNYFDQSVSDERFVNAEGDETINGNKTFSSSPSIPAATSGDHAVNLEQLTANLAHVVNDNDDFKLLEVYRLIDSTPIDLDDTRVKKYNIVFDGSSNGSVNINHLRDNQYYQFSNIAGTGADLRIGVEGYGMVDIVSPGKTAVYMSWGDGKLLKISENANVSII